MDKFVWGGAVLALLLSATAIHAHAECTVSGFLHSGMFCDGCQYDGSMSMAPNQTCESAYQPRQGGLSSRTALQFIDHRLVLRAKHGIAGLNGNTFAYAPTKGYVGQDDFTIEVLFRQGAKLGKFTVHWNVAVQ